MSIRGGTLSGVALNGGSGSSSCAASMWVKWFRAPGANQYIFSAFGSGPLNGFGLFANSGSTALTDYSSTPILDPGFGWAYIGFSVNDVGDILIVAKNNGGWKTISVPGGAPTPGFNLTVGSISGDAIIRGAKFWNGPVSAAELKLESTQLAPIKVGTSAIAADEIIDGSLWYLNDRTPFAPQKNLASHNANDGFNFTNSGGYTYVGDEPPVPEVSAGKKGLIYLVSRPSTLFDVTPSDTIAITVDSVVVDKFHSGGFFDLNVSDAISASDTVTNNKTGVSHPIGGLIYFIDANVGTIANSQINDTVLVASGNFPMRGSFAVNIPLDVTAKITADTLNNLVTSKFLGILGLYLSQGYTSTLFDEQLTSTNWDTATGNSYSLGGRKATSVWGSTLTSKSFTLTYAPAVVTFRWELATYPVVDTVSGQQVRYYQPEDPNDFTAQVSFDGGSTWFSVVHGQEISIPGANQGTNFKVRFSPTLSNQRRWIGSWVLIY